MFDKDTFNAFDLLTKLHFIVLCDLLWVCTSILCFSALVRNFFPLAAITYLEQCMKS